jgi:hypothetical protein
MGSTKCIIKVAEISNAGGWVGAADTGGGGSVDHGLLEFLGDPAGHGKNGIVIDGLVSWINLVQESVTENVWKQQVLSHYEENEISESKAELWKACEVNIGDTLKSRRQGDNKTLMEIDDIHKGLRKLKSDSKLPLILASSGMMAKAPSFGGISDKSTMGDVVSRVKELEECVGAFVKKQSEQMKELTEIVTISASQSKPLPPSFVRTQAEPETPRSKKRRLEDEQKSHQELSAPPAEHMECGEGLGVSYAAAAAAAVPAASQGVGGITPLQQKGAKKKTVLVYGKATTGRDDIEEILAADVELVATGVSRDASSDQLKNFIINKGIDVVEIVKLTTFEHARTNFFKIKIKAAQYEKAMKPEMWPLRVGVRHFRQPRRDQNKGTSWSEQSAQSGGVVGQQHHQRAGYQSNGKSQQAQPRPQYPQQPQYPPQYPPQFHQQPQGPQFQQPSHPDATSARFASSEQICS